MSYQIESAFSGAEMFRKLIRRRLTMASAVIAGLSGVAAYGQTMSPVAISGFTQDVIAENSPSTSTTTAGFDAYNNYALVASTYPGITSTGLPANGTIVSVANPSTTFQLAPYTGNNVLLFNTATNATAAPLVNSGDITLNTPGAYSDIALLDASANGSAPISYTIKFANGDTQTGSFAANDWFNNTPYAITNLGRVDRNGNPPENNGSDPRLYETDIAIQSADQSQKLTEIDFSASGSGQQWGLFALSGYATPATLVWAGLVNNTWDESTANWQGSAVFPATGGIAVFDDSAPSSATSITVASGGVTPVQAVFNNSTSSYTFSGGPVISAGTLTLNGTGSVTLKNSNTYSGAVILNSGTLVVGSGGSLDSSVLATSSSSATLNISSGAVVGSNSTMALTGPGTINLSGALTVGGNTQYVGNIGGSGSLTLTGGTITVSTGSFNVTGGVTVGTSATSTASLLITDSSGNAGTVSGVPFNVTLAGTGPAGTNAGVTANTGALAGADGSTVSYAGNITIAPAGASISGGNGGTLIVNGKISGSGAVAFSSNDNSTTVLNHSNSYTGETQIQGTSSASETSVLQIGVDNAIPTASGVNFISTASTNLLDLNSHKQSVAYLTGGTATSYIGNTGSSLSTLTINNGNNAAGPSTFTGVIRDGGPSSGSGQIALVKSGSGTQILSGSNTFSGGTIVSAGTLTASAAQALGTGPVTMSGGTLNLSVGAGNLNGFSGFTLNGGATLSNNTLTLTDGNGEEARTAFTPTPVVLTDAQGFTASFTYTPNGEADGTTFTIQNDSRGNSAVGGAGGGLAYGVGDGGTAIANSLSVQINLYSGQIGVGTNGAVNTTAYPYSFGTPPVYVFVGDPWQVQLNYNGSSQTLTETITDLEEQQFDPADATGTYTYTGIDLNALLGGNTGYVGFTGGDGQVTSTQQVSNFTFTDGGLTAPQSIGNAINTSTGTSSTLSMSVVTGLTSATIGNLTIAANSKLTLISSTATPGARGVLTTPALVIAGSVGHWTGTLDLTNNNLVVQNGNLTTITDQVKQGYGNGTWQGSGGITSSAAAADSTHLTALGVIINNDNGNPLYGTGTTLGLFDGASPGSSDVLVKYTYYGDTDLSGVVDGTDYSRIDAAYLADQTNPHVATGWFNGDFNYDGTVDGSDYTLMDNAFNSQGASLASVVATATAQIGAGAAVPEPATLSTLAVVAAGALGRRRRRR